MKHEIRISKSEAEEEEILVEGFRLYQNAHGNLCFYFSTPNHKYVTGGAYGNGAVLGEDGPQLWESVYWFYTEKDSLIEIKLISEDEEESKLLSESHDYYFDIIKHEFRIVLMFDEDIYDTSELERFRRIDERRRKLREAK